MSTIGVNAQTTEGTNALIYNNRAYVQSIGDSPNPVADRKVPNAKIIFVNTGYGPAIYSYPSNVAFQHTDFNVEYVDTAYGPAIYSYPYNNPNKHHLKLRDNKVIGFLRSIVPASFGMSRTPANTTGAVH